MKSQNYPEYAAEKVTLKDGRQIVLRPIRPSDAPLIQEGIARLSPETIYMRFLQVMNPITDEEALELATVDYINRMAFVGEIQEAGRPQLVCVARYGVIPEIQPRTAEAAIVVRDDYQSNGLGKLAMSRLIRYAQEHGVKVFSGTMHTTNQRILNFVAKSGFPYERDMLEPGVWEYKIFLDKEPIAE